MNLVSQTTTTASVAITTSAISKVTDTGGSLCSKDALTDQFGWTVKYFPFYFLQQDSFAVVEITLFHKISGAVCPGLLGVYVPSL